MRAIAEGSGITLMVPVAGLNVADCPAPRPVKLTAEKSPERLPVFRAVGIGTIAEDEVENPAEHHAAVAVHEVVGARREGRACDLKHAAARLREVEREARAERDRAGAVARCQRAEHGERLIEARERAHAGEAGRRGQRVTARREAQEVERAGAAGRAEVQPARADRARS